MTPKQTEAYCRLQEAARAAYAAKDKNTNPNKQRILNKQWLLANTRLDKFCEKYM